MTTDRTTRPAWALILQVAGGPRDLATKARGLGRVLAGWAHFRALDERLARLVDVGMVDEAPTRLQLLVGSADMLRFWITPAAADYYASQGINFWFHQLLRFLDDPGSMTDPLGFMSPRDTIIGHVLQVVHANPCYDLQLLESFPDGVAELERQTGQMLAGTHPRHRSIMAVVEDPEYHARLLDYVRAYRRDRDAAPPIRANVAASEAFQQIEHTFGTLPAAMRYMTKLPRTPLGAAQHLVRVRTFPQELAESPPVCAGISRR